MSGSSSRKSVFVGLVWVLIALLIVFVVAPVSIMFIVVFGLFFLLAEMVSVKYANKIRTVYNTILVPWHTAVWYVVYYGVIKGLYNILDVEYYRPWMGVELNSYNSYDHYKQSLKGSVRRRMTKTLDKTFRVVDTDIITHQNKAQLRLLLKPSLLRLMFESCRRKNDDMLMSVASFMNVYLVSVLFPFSIKEYYQQGHLVGYLIYGVKGNSLLLVECVSSANVRKQMVYHHMIRDGIQEAFDRDLSYVSSGFHSVEAKKMTGLSETTNRDLKGFTFKSFKVLV